MNLTQYHQDLLTCLLGAEYFRALKIIDASVREWSAEDVLL